MFDIKRSEPSIFLAVFWIFKQSSQEKITLKFVNDIYVL